MRFAGTLVMLQILIERRELTFTACTEDAGWLALYSCGADSTSRVFWLTSMQVEEVPSMAKAPMRDLSTALSCSSSCQSALPHKCQVIHIGYMLKVEQRSRRAR